MWNRYLVIGGILVVLGVLVLAVNIWAYVSHMDAAASPDPQHWGLFGDFFGGSAGTLIGFLTLIGLAATLWVQGTELVETRKHLGTAAREAENQTTEAKKQTEQQRTYEELRIRPLLKAEWHPMDASYSLVWRITNVGLGPAILDRIELHVTGAGSGSHPAGDVHNALEDWRTALRDGLGDLFPGKTAVRSASMHQLKRILGAGEHQETIYFDLQNSDSKRNVYNVIDSIVVPVIYFRSLTGERFTTQSQMDLQTWTPPAST